MATRNGKSRSSGSGRQQRELFDEQEEYLKTQKELTQTVMESAQFTEGDKMILLWQLDKLAGWRRSFMDVLSQADPSNLARFEKGFPIEVDALKRWRDGSLATRFRELGIAV